MTKAKGKQQLQKLSGNPMAAYSLRKLKSSTSRHVITCTLENEPGALSRVIELFSARGYNIDSLTVAPTEDETLSRMTIVSMGADVILEQITKQLNKLIEIVKVVELSITPAIERELMMIRLEAIGDNREELKRLVDIFHAKIINVTPNSFTIEITGDSEKLDSFITALPPSIILETARSGVVAIART